MTKKKVASRSLTTKSGKVKSLTRQDIRGMRSASAVLPLALVETIVKRKRGQRGAQKEPKKISVTARYSPDVVTYFKSTGEGWQVRMDNALKEWIKKHPRRLHKD